MHKDINEIKNDISEIKNDINQLKEQQKITNKRHEKPEHHQINTNLAIGELHLSVIKLADRLEIIAEHGKELTGSSKLSSAHSTLYLIVIIQLNLHIKKCHTEQKVKYPF